MHSLLTRQLKEALGEIDVTQMTSAWQRFFALVDKAYASDDEERTILNRTLEISSKEYGEIRTKLLADIAQRDAELVAMKNANQELMQKIEGSEGPKCS